MRKIVHFERHLVEGLNSLLSFDDDIYIIVENLRKYLNSKEIVQATKFGKSPIFLGRKFMPKGNLSLIQGGLDTS